MINGIVCVDKHWGIGKNNDLLFHIKEDMKMFKELTTGKVRNTAAVCMGYNTLMSLPGSKPLKDRLNIILTSKDIEVDNGIVVHKFEDFVRIVKEVAKTYEVFVIGGGQLYEAMLPYYDKIYVTKVDAVDEEATVFFPNLSKNKNFTIINSSKSKTTSKGLKFKFVEYGRKNV